MKILYRLYILCIFLLLTSSAIFSQSLSINTDGSTANVSAMLDIKSNTKGLLIPRLTKTEKNNVASPATGLLIYQTGPDSSGFYYYQNFHWNWLTDTRMNDSSYWGLHGNSNMRPPAANYITPIDFANDTYLGSVEDKDISMIGGGNELMRLKAVQLGGRVGLSNRNPEYALDIRLSDYVPPTTILGMRIIPSILYDFSNAGNIDKGFVIGANVNDVHENLIWNYSSNVDGIIRIGIDAYNNNTIRPAVNINQYGEGIYQRNPRYALDIHSMSQFAFGYPSINKNGVRITFPNQENSNNDQRGLFMGVSVNSQFKSYIWNHADGTGGNSPDKAIYFGVGADMDMANQPPTMELQDGKIMMGHVMQPNFFYPSTLNLQTDYATNVAKNGLSIMKHLANGVESVYFGTDQNDNLDIFKLGSGNIYLSASTDPPITIRSDNFVGIKTTIPTAPLQFDESYANNKLVLHNNFWGDFPNSGHNFYGFGVNANVLRYQVPGNGADHVFYAANTTNTASNELMRIKGNGFVGIGNSNPQAPLEFSSAAENRKIVLGGFGVNNDHNFVGFGLNGLDLRYQVPYSNSDHVFYRGDVAGFSSTELIRIKGNGNVGIGTSTPSDYGHLGINKVVEIKNEQFGGYIQSHLILSSNGSSGLLGGITWTGGYYNFTNEQRTGFISNSYESGYQTKISIYTRSSGGVLDERFYVQGDGNAWLQGTLTQASDARLKQNIKQLPSTLNKLEQMNGYTYNWINDQRDKEEQIGLLAQEVQKNYPQLVRQNDKGELSVNYSGLVPVLLEGIKEQQKQIEILKDQNALQQQQIESILKKIK